MQKKTSDAAGFTLIEVLVSFALFTVVMIVSVSSLLAIMAANERTRAIKSVVNNLSFAIENMSKNIRSGTTYYCHTGNPATPPSASVLATKRNCGSGGQLVAFEGGETGDSSDMNDQIVYRFLEVGGKGRIERSLDSGATFVPLTSPEVDIDHMDFRVLGALAADGTQPLVILTLRGVITVRNNLTTELSIQTAMTQRVLDL